METQELTYKKVLKKMPERIKNIDMLDLLSNTKIDWPLYVLTLKKTTGLNDDLLSSLFNVNVKTFRTFKKPNYKVNLSTKERLLMLLMLYRHGEKVFEKSSDFEQWLNTENFFFDKKAPIDFLTTTTGMRFIDDRLTAMEYGDNV